jgi:hypothetical protein
MEYAKLLYDPIYAAFGVPTVLTPNRTDATGVSISAIERTTSTDTSEQFELGTLRPAAFVRRRELDEAGIAPAELDGGTLAFNGRSWRIEAHAHRPGPDGEASGEILVYLVEVAEA